MPLYDNLLTLFILVILFLIIYLRVANRTLPEFVSELKELISSDGEEV